MDKNKFLDMNIDSQIEYLNSRLNEGLTVIRIREDLNIGEKALQKLIKDGGYKYNSKTKNYIKVTEVVQGYNDNQTVVNYNNNQVVVDYAEYKDMIDTIRNMNDRFEEMYNWYELQTKVIEKDTLRIEANDNDTVTRSFKVYKDIYEDFMELSKKKYSTYKVQDLISQAIKEFCNKYK